MTKALMISLLFIMMVVTGPGCDEEYQIETDEEFQQSVDEAVEDVFRGNVTQDYILDQLVEEYSDRYADEEIVEFAKERLDEEEDELLSVIDSIEQRTYELEDQALEYVEELDGLVDRATMEEVEKEVDLKLEQIEALSDELDATEDLYQMIDILEEMEAIFEEMVFTLEDTLHEAEEGTEEETSKEISAENHVEEDLTAYIEKIEPLGEQEIAIVTSYESVTGEQYEGDDVMYSELVNNIIPATEDLLATLRNISPQTSEVQDLHQQFIEGWEMQLKCFNTMEEALEKQDEELVEEANLLLEQGSQKLEQFNQQLNQKAENYGIQFE